MYEDGGYYAAADILDITTLLSSFWTNSGKMVRYYICDINGLDILFKVQGILKCVRM